MCAQGGLQLCQELRPCALAWARHRAASCCGDNKRRQHHVPMAFSPVYQQDGQLQAEFAATAPAAAGDDGLPYSSFISRHEQCRQTPR